MDKAAMEAFEKMQRREHWLRVIRDRKGCGRITMAQFKAEERAILERYALTQDEERAYELHNRVMQQRKRV